MLDAFEILTTSGVVLFSKAYAPLSPHVINSLINDVFIEQRAPAGQEGKAASYKKERYTLKWSLAKDVGLIFVAVYQSLLHLSWVDNLLEVVRALFAKTYATELKSTTTPNPARFTGFRPTFDALVHKLDTASSPTGQRRASSSDGTSAPEFTPPSSSDAGDDAVDEPPPPPMPGFKKPGLPASVTMNNYSTSTGATPEPTPDASRPSTPLQASAHLLMAKAGPWKGSRRSRKANTVLNPAPVSSGDESPARSSKMKVEKKGKRIWNADGVAVDEDEDVVLDYSAPPTSAPKVADKSFDVDAVQADNMGQRTGKGQFVLKDLDDEVEAILSQQQQQQQQSRVAAAAANDNIDSGGLLGTASNKLSGLFRNVVGGKTLTKVDLEKPLQGVLNHLLEKNVAREAAVRLCQSVETDLIGLKTSSFTSIEATIKASMSKALTRILTPTTSLDLLRAINSTTTGSSARPYVISIVGVNGVGKSTNLSKLAYFLLQNNFRVLIVAADTFRSGAVEQLRVHVRNLTELSRRENTGSVDIFEKGYGKDAATVARDAVTYAANHGKGDMLFDIVLIDTAGRRHNDSRLMSSLTKFGQLANPDKIFMVGEALVGTDSVAQARNFAKEFVDMKGVMRNGGIGMDGFIVSKCDTVGDMVGTLVSMVHATGIPVVFLGVGQHYGDLRGLNVGWAVDKLIK